VTAEGRGTQEGLVQDAMTPPSCTAAAIDALSGDRGERIASELPDIDVGAGTFVDRGGQDWFRGCHPALGPGDDHLLDAFATEGPIVFAEGHNLGAGSIDGAIESGELAATRLRRFLARR